MKLRAYKLTLISGCLVAILVLSFIVSVAQYSSIERQREIVAAMSLLRESSRQMEYSDSLEKLTKAAALSVTTASERQILSMGFLVFALLLVAPLHLAAYSAEKRVLSREKKQ